MQVGWDESTAGERQPRVSLWEIEPLTTFPMYPSPFPLRLKRPWPSGLPSFPGTTRFFLLSYDTRAVRPEILISRLLYLGMKTDDMGLNPSLMWLRGDGGMQSLNQGMGVTPWMQPRFDTSVLGMQNDIYQAMAAAAMQDMRVVDPSKQMLSSMMQFQQPQAVSSRPAGLMHPQMLQPSQCSSPFVHPGSQSQAPPQSHANLLQQQLLQPNSFNNVQIQQQQQQQHQQHHSPSQHVIDHQQVSGVTPILSQLSSNSQAQTQAMHSMPSMHHNFSESNVKPVGNISSPLHSLLSSVTQDDTANLLNMPRPSNLLSSNGWPTKRVALDPLSNGLSQSISPRADQLGMSNTNAATNPISLPPFPGRECLMEQEAHNDPQNHFLFGVNIDSSSLLMPNGMSNLKAVVSDSDNATMAFASSSYMSSSGADYSLNPTMTSSSCIDESGFLMSTDNGGNENAPNRTFVKVTFVLHYILGCVTTPVFHSRALYSRCVFIPQVHKSGSFGRSLDITKFSSYPELRSELAQMFGLEGELEDPLRSGWQLVFVDRENDVLLLGDDPWQ